MTIFFFILENAVENVVCEVVSNGETHLKTIYVLDNPAVES